MIFLNLALRNVFRNRERSLLTLIGVLLAIGSFVALVSLAEGLYRRVWIELRGRSVDLYLMPADAGVMLPTGPIGTVGLTSDTISQDALEKVRALKNVQKADGIGRQIWTGKRAVIPVLEIPPDSLSAWFPNLQPTSGEIITADSEKQVMLGVGVAHTEFPNGVANVLQHGQTEYQVAAIVRGGGFRDYFAYVPIAPDRAEKGYQEVWIQVADKAQAEGTRTEINNLQLPGVRVISSDEYMGQLKDFINYAWLLQFAISSIGVLISITAAMNTMLMSTYERLREFSTLRAIGATRLTVVLMILSESVILSMAGGCLGLIFGWLASGLLDRAVVVLLQVPFPLAQVTPRLLAEAMALSAFVGVVGSIIPAWLVWRLNLVDGLRWD